MKEKLPMHFLRTTLLVSTRRKTSLAVLGTLALGALVSLPASAQTIDTVPSWNGTTGFSAWGTPNTQTYGQTITGLAGFTQLDSFTIRVTSNGSFSNTNFQAYVYNWVPGFNRITGSALWSSGTQNTGTMTTGVYVPFTFTPNVAVTAGNPYVLLFSTIGQGNSGTHSGRMGAITSGAPYTGGQFVFLNTNTFSNLSILSWNTQFTTGDLAFTANFSNGSAVTPELPGAMQLLPALLPVALIGARKRFKKA